MIKSYPNNCFIIIKLYCIYVNIKFCIWILKISNNMIYPIYWIKKKEKITSMNNTLSKKNKNKSAVISQSFYSLEHVRVS